MFGSVIERESGCAFVGVCIQMGGGRHERTIGIVRDIRGERYGGGDINF